MKCLNTNHKLPVISIDLPGFEPTTSDSPSRHSSKWAVTFSITMCSNLTKAYQALILLLTLVTTMSWTIYY